MSRAKRRLPWEPRPPYWSILSARNIQHTPRFRSLCSTPKLFTAMEDLIRRGRVARGCDGVSLNAFAGQADVRIPELADELKQRTFRPQPAVHRNFRRADGKLIDAHVSAIEDSVVERVLYNEISPSVEAVLCDTQLAYRRRGSQQLAHHVTEEYARTYHFALVVDVRGSFPSVPIASVMEKFARLVKDPALLEYLRRFLHAGIARTVIVDGRAEYELESNDGLLVGRSLSPLAANLYLATFAKRLTRRVPCLIYSDDIVLFAHSRRKLERMLAWMKANLPAGMKLNEDKTCIVDLESGETLNYLGITFGRQGAEYSSAFADAAAAEILSMPRGKRRRGVIASYIGRVHIGDRHSFWRRVLERVPEGTGAALIERLGKHQNRRQRRGTELKRMASKYIAQQTRVRRAYSQRRRSKNGS